MESRTDQESDRKWILVVDSDAQTQRLLDLSLRNAGFEVHAVGGAADGLTWLGSHRCDLVIADARLDGDVDGFELCRRMKQLPEGATIPFVFLAEATMESRMRGVQAGADDFLTKPVYVQEVVGRARSLLQRRERERLEALVDGDDRFIGELADLPLVDLLRAVGANRKSGVVHIRGPEGARGEIYFRQGAVVDAEAGRLSGREAVYRLFSWSTGRFEIEWKSIRRKDAVATAPDALMVEALRRLEEWRRLLADMPPLDTIFEVDYRLLADRLAEIPDEVNGILRLFDGVRTFIQVIDDCGLGDLEAVAVIGKLYREGIIRDINVKAEVEPSGADIEGWLTDAVGPFRAAAPERVRRELFGASPETGIGVHGRPTVPFEPLEEAGREVLIDDMRARFTDRLNAEGRPGPGTAAAPSLAATAPGPGAAAPSSARAAAAHVSASAAATPAPAVTAPAQRPGTPPAGTGTGDGIPQPVVIPEGDAIVIPFPTPASVRRAAPGAVAAEDARAVAGEIVARAPSQTARGMHVAQEMPAVRDEQRAPPPRATDPGLGPDPTPERPPAVDLRPAVLTPSGSLASAAGSGTGSRALRIEAFDAANAAANANANSNTGDDDDAFDQIKGGSRARGLVLVGASIIAIIGAWAVLHGRGGAESPAAPAAEGPTSRAAAVPPAAAAPSGSALGTEAAAAQPVNAAGAAAIEPEAGDVDERASDPKLARGHSTEFPQLLTACRNAYSEARMKDAEAACAAAKDANPRSAEAYALLAHAMFNRNRRRDALTWAERAVKIDPKLADAYVIIGGVHQDQGDLPEAKRAYKRYLDLAPTGPYAADLRAIVDSL
jgi:CheY-like chemotaxis protein